MPATRGRRNPALLEQQPAQPAAPTGYTRQFFCGRKPLTYLGDSFQPGERMPDSVGVKMPRLDTRIRQGLIHVQFAPEGTEAPPPAPPAPPSTGLAEAMKANLAHAAATDPVPTDCEHGQEHYTVTEIDGVFYAVCSKCGARTPVADEVQLTAEPDKPGGE